MSAFKKSERVEATKNGHTQRITLTLHNGNMNKKGFISIAMMEFITPYSSDFAKSYNSLNDLFSVISDKEYKFKFADITKVYNDLKSIKF